MSQLVDANGASLNPYGEIKIPNVRVVGPRVLVLPKPKTAYTTAGGIYVPEAAQEDIKTGVVIKVGDGLVLGNGERIPSAVEPGDEIIYAAYAGVPLNMDEFRYLIIMEQDIRLVKTYVGKVFVELDGDGNPVN